MSSDTCHLAFRSVQSRRARLSAIPPNSRHCNQNSRIPQGGLRIIQPVPRRDVRTDGPDAWKILRTDAAMSALLMKKDESHLIHEKIAVPNAFPRVSRLRLLKLLAENVVCCNATIINGRAGTGKTTLAADFARHAGRAVSWYKVDAADSDLRQFCEYLSTTLQRQRPSIDTERLLQMTETAESDRA